MSVAYAPVVLPNGTGCTMSARGGARGLILEIDRPETVIPLCGVVRETEPERERERIEEAVEEEPSVNPNLPCAGLLAHERLNWPKIGVGPLSSVPLT